MGILWVLSAGWLPIPSLPIMFEKVLYELSLAVSSTLLSAPWMTLFCSGVLFTPWMLAPFCGMGLVGDCLPHPIPTVLWISQTLCDLSSFEQGVSGAAADVSGFHAQAGSHRGASLPFAAMSPSASPHPFQPCYPSLTPWDTSCLGASSRQH